MNDLDLLLDSTEDGLRLTCYLRRRGYEYEANEVPWLKATAAGRPYGQVNLRYAGPGRRPNLDLHFGGYSVRHCARLGPRMRGGPGLFHADREDSLVYITANAAGDHLITAKDLNDVALCLLNPATDWERILTRLREVDLAGFLGRVLGAVAETCLFDAGPAAVLRRLIAACGTEPVAPSAKRRWQRRWLSTVAHAYRHGRRVSQAQAVRAAVTAARYYRAPLRPKLTRYGPKRMPRPAPWTCVRLFPADVVAGLYGTGAADRETILARLPAATTSLVGSGGLLDVHSTRRGDLVVSADTVFVPTVYHRLRADLVAAMCQ